MAVCDLANNPKHCSVAQSRYPRPECAGCEAGKKNDAITAERTAKEAPQVPRETIQPKKEEAVPEKMDVKERVLAKVQRSGPCSATKILTCCNVKGAELHRIAGELNEEKKIRTWKDGAKLIFTTYDAPDPRSAGTNNNQQQPAATDRKAATPPEKKIVRLTTKKSASTAGSPPPGNGGGRTGSAYEHTIAALMAQRQKIDNAIAALRDLA